MDRFVKRFSMISVGLQKNMGDNFPKLQLLIMSFSAYGKNRAWSAAYDPVGG
jgi:hypothetical protein